MKKFFVFYTFSFLVYALGAQTLCTIENRQLFEQELNRIQNSKIHKLPINQIAIEVGTHFMGTPYVAHTLEVSEEESLIVELTGLDCTTFIENVVTFSRLAKQQRLNFDAFINELEYLRYRAGKRQDYPSRLHYFSEWIQDNTQKNIIKDITAEIGGVPYNKALNFMSTHRDSYKQLANDDYLKDIVEIEKELNQYQKHYIPKQNLKSLENHLQDGDLIAITTTISGLDVVHTGMVKWQKGRVHLFHASSKNKKVEISDVPLVDYLNGNKLQSGVMVCRLVEARSEK